MREAVIFVANTFHLQIILNKMDILIRSLSIHEHYMLLYLNLSFLSAIFIVEILYMFLFNLILSICIFMLLWNSIFKIFF